MIFENSMKRGPAPATTRKGDIVEQIRIGISSCLLGEKVRYDGQHKLDRFCRDVLGEYVEYVPVCPEVECGLPVPRESMHLEGDPEAPRLITTRTRKDLTDQMVTWANRRVRELEKEELGGFIFKSRSPSSGMERVKIYDSNKIPKNSGSGLFASAFMKHFPLLPVEEEGRLHDAVLRESFIERIFIFKRWQQMTAGGLKRGALVDFHSRHKLAIMAHSPKHLKLLGPLVAAAKSAPPMLLFTEYQKLLQEGLKLRATVRKNTNVLQHMMGYFKKVLSSDEKAELLEVIGRYHSELVPLIVPLTLFNHYVRKFEEPYLALQTYLNPHPIELKLRNHA